MILVIVSAISLDTACRHGHHNPLGCVCAYGWAGPLCDRFTLPACLASSSASSESAMCTAKQPQSCACVEQCIASGTFAAHIWPVCVQRATHNLSKAARRKEVEAGGAQLLRWQLSPRTRAWSQRDSNPQPSCLE